ncbi:hypothetical protein LTR41_002456 [Exophiala xenobiotica]|nr:hypothetical protein LTR41_002456 [Exophiala xenobiotica]
MDSVLKIAGQLAGGKQGQGQGQSSGTSGVVHKITDAVTGQSHPEDRRNQQPYGGFPGTMSGPEVQQRIPYPGNPASQYEPNAGHGQMNGPYQNNYQGRPAQEHSGAYGSGPGRNDHYPGGYDKRDPRAEHPPFPQNHVSSYGVQPGPNAYENSNRDHGFDGREPNYSAGHSYEQPRYEQRGYNQYGYDQHGNKPTGHSQQEYNQHGNSQHGYEQRGYGQH